MEGFGRDPQCSSRYVGETKRDGWAIEKLHKNEIHQRKQLFPKRSHSVSKVDQDQTSEKKRKSEYNHKDGSKPTSSSSANESSSTDTHSILAGEPSDDTKLSPFIRSLTICGAKESNTIPNWGAKKPSACPANTHPWGCVVKGRPVTSGPRQPTGSRIIQSLLNSPMGKTNRESSEVTSIVNGILSTTGKPQARRYMVVPVSQTPAASSTSSVKRPSAKYVLLNAASLHSSSAIGAQVFAKQMPLVITPLRAASLHQPTGNIKQFLSYQSNYHHVSQRCTAVISSNVDTIHKWLDCNRDILGKTLVSVAQKLHVSVRASVVLLRYRGKLTEHVALKWLGIALMIITKYEINQATGSCGTPIPSTLYSMWNNLSSFFTIYEGCLQLVKEQRTNTIATRLLRMEDETFEEVVESIFAEYNRVTKNAKIPTTSDLKKLDVFIGSLESNLPTNSIRNEGIRSVLNSNIAFPLVHFQGVMGNVTSKKGIARAQCTVKTKGNKRH